MKLKEFFHSGTDREVLLNNSIGSFEELWNIKSSFIEEPNYRRGGWSGIILHEIRLQNGLSLKIVIKRQQNHAYKSLMHPVSGTPTLFREYNNICRLEKLGIPTLEPLYYGERRADGNIQAVLVIRFLEEYRNLDDILDESAEDEFYGENSVIEPLAGMIAQVHSHRFQHSCLYGKHVFVKKRENGPPDIRLIDLEKMHPGLTRFSVAVHDLGALFRHSRWPGDDVWNLFMKSYLSRSGLGKKGDKILKALDKKIKKKISKRPK